MKNFNRLGLSVAVAAAMASPILHGEGEGDTSFTQEQLDAAIATAVETAKTEVTTGLTAKNQELLNELKAAKGNAKKFEGLDIESLQALQTQMESDEVLKLHAEGKHNEAYDKMMEKERVTWNAEKESYETKMTDLIESNKTNEGLVQTLLVDGGAKSAFIEAKGLPTATEDIALRARQVWKVEAGVPVARDEKGEMIQGEKGPLTMKEWAEGLKESAPHLFPASEGGSGNGGDGGGGDNDSIDAQILAASQKGDVAKVRALRKKQREGK